MSTIIDVREPEEYAAGHFDSAISMPPDRFRGELKELQGLPKDSEIILYCRTGSRANVALQILKQRGYTNLINGINQNYVRAAYGGEDSL